MDKTDTTINTLSKPDHKTKRSKTNLKKKTDKPFSEYSDKELQEYLLQKVSRTFALTIPELPEKLSYVVSNAYLLCRIVDTIEDAPNLSASEKKHYCDQFIKVVTNQKEPKGFADKLSPLFSEQTLPGEVELIQLTPRVINITHQFDREEQKAIERCVRKMSRGMVYYQENASVNGLKDLEEMNDYCYYVAGVVGEMLTELFCHYSPEIAKHKDKLMNLAVSFGQGLQMTNILKDVWEDYNRSACWLPRNFFDENLKNLATGESTPDFQKGIQRLTGIAQGHLKNALEYTLLIPSEEKGIRQFCYWAIGMAVLTLQNIYRNPDFTSGDEVKISRKSVKATVFFTNKSVHNDRLLKSLFFITSWGLPVHRS